MSAKLHFQSGFEEFEGPPSLDEKSGGTARRVESIRLGLTVLALLAGMTILGTSADVLAVYNQTHLGQEFLLPLWPSDFNIGPNIALIACGAIVVLASAVPLLVSKVQSVRENPLIHSSISFLAPTVGLIAGLIGISFFYGVNASSTVYSIQAWTCQWSSLTMTTAPYWGTLCKESKVALYLMVMIVPLEVLVLGTAAWGAFARNKQVVFRERKGSPAMS